MRWNAVILFAVCAAAASVGAVAAQPGDAIAEVLERSQQVRLDAMQAATPESPRTLALQADFDTLARTLDLGHPIELRVVQGDIVGETLRGRVVVVNESIATLPEGERLFILAHEMGHVALDHWTEMGSLYRKWVPGAVEQSHTDAIANELGREASALAHQQEFQADAFALHALRSLGRPDDDVLATFIHLGMRNDTATHPGTRRRMAALQALMRADARMADSATAVRMVAH